MHPSNFIKTPFCAAEYPAFSAAFAGKCCEKFLFGKVVLVHNASILICFYQLVGHNIKNQSAVFNCRLLRDVNNFIFYKWGSTLHSKGCCLLRAGAVQRDTAQNPYHPPYCTRNRAATLYKICPIYRGYTFHFPHSREKLPIELALPATVCTHPALWSRCNVHQYHIEKQPLS